MNSNSLLKHILLLAIVAFMIGGARPARAAEAQYYELRVYSTQSEVQQQRVDDYWQNAAIPAYRRMGIGPIGVFTEQGVSPTNRVYVLIPCDSLKIFGQIPGRLATDGKYQAAAAEFLDATKTNAAYERMESSLLVAFEGMKRLVQPSRDRTVFELRTYLSPGEAKGLNKIKMFESGEITVMKEVGLAPVFYGRMVVGGQMPCLMYMTCGENLEEHGKHWQAFSSSPVWKQLQEDPEYKDNMIGMIRVLLKRMAGSEI